MLDRANKNAVKVLPGLFRERMDVNREYLMELETQGLLQNFYLEAGIIMPNLQVVAEPDKAKLHWGWEAPICQLRGHFLGHWLSAAASLIATEKDQELSAKLNKIIAELGRCQELNGGQWIGSIPEKYFTKLENNQYIWSPQYVMHKTLLGLMHAYMYAGNEQALTILSNQADWYVQWIEKLKKQDKLAAVYRGEEGGMLEVWATLYALTREEKYLTLSQCYDHPGMFSDLLAGKDALTNCHANASIPWAQGAAMLYEVTGKTQWRTIVEQFWKNAVTDRGSYCSGGQGAGEFWTPPDMLGQFLGHRNQEFCTVYNMVRLADYLYRWTGDKQYADYIEKNLYNGFLAQQNAYTGMPAYFLPLQAGAKKIWGSKTHDFWCCHGTMVQAQTLYPSLIYYTDALSKRLLVSQYIPSKFSWDQETCKVTIEQNVNMKYYNDAAFFDEQDKSQMSRWSLKFHIHTESKADTKAVPFTVSLRLPDWVTGAPVLMMNQQEVKDIAVEDGYINLCKEWKDDEVLLYLPSSLHTVSFSDMPELEAVLEGPIVLAGMCDKDTGLYGDSKHPEEFLVPQYEHTYSVFPWKQSTYKTIHQPQNFTMRPLYEIADETYTVYFSSKKN